MMKLVKRSIAALLLGMMCLCLLPATIVKAEETYNTEVKKSVAVIRSTFITTDGYTLYTSTGSGFFVGESGTDPKYVVTNWHVIEEYLYYGQGELVKVTLKDGTVVEGRAKLFLHYTYNDYEEIYYVNSSQAKDLAILELDAATSKKKPLKLANVTEDMVGQTVYVVGYPGISDNYLTGAVEIWDEKGVTVYKGAINRFLTETGSGQKKIMTDATMQHGDSGGPMVTPEGYVVGINVEGAMNAQGESTNYAVNVNDLIPMLNQNSIPYEMANASQNSGDTQTNTPPITINPTPTPEPEPDPGLSPVVIIAVALIVVGGVVAIVFIMKNKKPQQQPAPAPMPAPAPTPARRGILRSMSAQHMGMTIALTPGQEIYIGRNTAVCRMIFQDNTPGVSSRHCSLVYDGNSNQFILTDLQSTYGTYLANGQRLAPGVGQYVRAGECFYLGDKANMLRVEVE